MKRINVQINCITEEYEYSEDGKRHGACSVRMT